MQESYHWWWSSKRMSQKQIREMISNMKKSQIINQKSNEYHKKEQIDAEDILKQLDKK